MSHEIMDSWVEKARTMEAPKPPSGVKVIKNSHSHNKGNLIMEVAEKLRPWFQKMFEGVRDENGMLMQPSRIRGIALNVAQRIVNEQASKPTA